MAVVVIGHAVLEPGGLPVPPAFVAAVAVWLLVLAARARPRTGAGRGGTRQAVPGSPLTRPPWAPRTMWALTRLGGVLLLLLAIVVGRLRNGPLAPTLVISIAWPALLLGSALLGQVWRWVNPFDTLARLLEPPEAAMSAERATARQPVLVTSTGNAVSDDRPVVPTSASGNTSSPGHADLPMSVEGGVAWAAIPALAWMYYLHVAVEPLRPNTVAIALGTYTLATLAGCMAVGRMRWLQRVEVFGLLFSWIGRVRDGGLVGWRPPDGTNLVLGVLIGGLLFGSVQTSTLWPPLPFTPWFRWYPLIGLLTTAGAGVLLLGVTDRWAGRLGTRGSVTAALVPMVAAVGVVTAANRLFVGVGSLPRLLSDPLDLGWDPVGASGWAVTQQLLGGVALVLLQLIVLVVGAVVGIQIARARAGSHRGVEPALAALGVVLGTGTLAVTAV